ncbi:MAG: hypothetical protein GY838_12955 [bacterium]|nr:hypothetical protein [bacterium]
MGQWIKFGIWCGLVVVMAPVAAVAVVADAVTGGAATGLDYIDPYDPERRCETRQYERRPDGGWRTTGTS